MNDFGAIKLSSPSREMFAASFTSVFRALPPEMGIRLRDILINYFQRSGMDAAFERMNNRTVAQIFVEFDGMETNPIASGEKDGLRWALHEASNPPTTHGERTVDE